MVRPGEATVHRNTPLLAIMQWQRSPAVTRGAGRGCKSLGLYGRRPTGQERALFREIEK